MNHATTNRRQCLVLLAAGTAALPAWAASPAPTPVQVWKDPSCGCCKDWIAHMQANGFAATVHESGNTGARARLGLPMHLGSCHTALVEGYVIEGHVPASDVRRLLKEKPRALGLTVPGMPVGSPGMDGPEYKGRQDAYDVLLVRPTMKKGKVITEVFTSYS
ncbi:MAG: DUF411 domain-containing protein [Comamonas sp.]